MSEIFLDVFLKPMGSAFEPLGYTGRFFVQSAGKLAGIVPCMDIAQQDFAVRIGKSGKGGTMHDESLLCEQPIFRRILDSDGIAEGQAVFVQLLIKTQSNGDGIEAQDVDVLKLLYLIRYIDDIPANLDNIVILMADDIRMDKITMRETVRECLNRLMSQNYIGRTGEVYNFLTDEEQDIQREIKNTPVDTASIVDRIGQMIFGDIFTTKKYRYGKYDFSFDQMVDGRPNDYQPGGSGYQQNRENHLSCGFTGT